MFKEAKYVFYLLTIFFAFFIVLKTYFSENNIKNNNKILLQHQNKSNKKFENLEIISNDTDSIIEYTNEV